MAKIPAVQVSSGMYELGYVGTDVVTNTIFTGGGASIQPYGALYDSMVLATQNAGNILLQAGATGSVSITAPGGILSSNYANINGVYVGQRGVRIISGSTSYSNITLDNVSAKVTIGGNLTVTAGGLTVTAGGATITAGAVTISAGNLVGAAAYDVTGFGRVYNAVWNDIADFIEVRKDTPIKYGVVYVRDSISGVHRIATSYAADGIVGISSDTYGFGVGKNEKVKQIPIAIGGFVLAYVDAIYTTGTPLTSAKDGGLTKAKLFTRIFNPEKILATFYKPESLTVWHEGIIVDERSWVRIK